MTREEITRMAQEAGFVGFDGENKCLREFAALVAAAEKKRLEATAWGASKKWIVEAVAAEREACAKVCEAMRPSKEEFDQRYYAGCTDSAAAIRARGKT